MISMTFRFFDQDSTKIIKFEDGCVIINILVKLRLNVSKFSVNWK